MGELLPLCNYCRVSGDGPQTPVGQQDQQIGGKPECGAEEEDKLEYAGTYVSLHYHIRS